MKVLATVCRLLGKLGSDSEAERLAAANLANRQMKELGLSWFDLAGIDHQGKATRSNVAKVPDNLGKFTEEEAKQIYDAAYQQGWEDSLQMQDIFQQRKKVVPHHQLNTATMLTFCERNPSYLTAMDRELINTFDAWSIRNPWPMQYKELVLTYSRVTQAVRAAKKMEATTRKQRRRA